MAQLPDDLARAIHEADISTPTSHGTPEEQMQADMLASGLDIDTPPDIVLDGKIHRFRTNSDHHTEKSGWYVAFMPDTSFGARLAAGAFGNWRISDEAVKWYQEPDETLSPAEINVQLDLARTRIEYARVLAEQQRQADRAQAAKTATEIWNATKPASNKHPYLVSKKVEAHGLHATDGDNNLLVPMYRMATPANANLNNLNHLNTELDPASLDMSADNLITNEITSLQYISGTPDEQGKFSKRFMGGGEIGVFVFTGDRRHIFVCEGFATGASIHEATDATVVIAFSAYNLPHVVKTIRELYPKCPDLCIVADNDKSGVGEKKALEAAQPDPKERAIARVVMPPVLGQDANDYACDCGKAALRDLLLKPKKIHRLANLTDIQPPRWLIKDYIPKRNKLMLFGASGSGKTFVILDMALHIATSGMDDWFGYSVKHGVVAYLAGEDSDGVTLRARTYCEHHSEQHPGLADPDLYISECGFNLDTVEGLNEVIADLKLMPKPPELIIVDTLARNFAGNENDSQDVNKMLDNCDLLQKLFGCSVCFVHHTGISSDAQNRARGSSSWYAGLDYQLQVKKDEDEICDDLCIKLLNNKARNTKAMAPMKFILRTIAASSILNEDGTPYTTLTLEHDPNAAPSEPPLSNAAQEKLELFRDAMNEGGKEIDGTIGISDEELRSFVYEDYGEDAKPSTKRLGFKRFKETLVKAGKISSRKIDKVLYWFFNEDDFFTDLEVQATRKNQNKRE